MVTYKKTLAALLLLAGLGACKKKDNPYQEFPAYEAGTMVSLNNYYDADGNFGYIRKELSIKDTLIDVGLEVKLVNTTAVAANDVKVYLKKQDAIVTAYNSSFVPVPVSSAALLYDFSQPAIIKKGERTASINIKVNPSKLNLAVTNAFGFIIERAEGAAVQTGKTSELVIEFGTRNKYDGLYRVKGYATLGANTTAPYTFQIPCGPDAMILTTSGVSSVDIDAQPVYRNGITYFNGFYPRLEFNTATDKVTNVAATAPGNTLAYTFPDPSATTPYDSRYDPATKTIYVRYRVVNAGWYVIDTLTYCGPR